MGSFLHFQDCGGFPGWLMDQHSMARKSSPENDANSKE